MKLKYALRNLYISQAIILLFLVFAYYFWFPNSFSKLGGFYKTAWMLILVDLVLGPLLVLLVYKEGKKLLKFDLNVLLGIQIIAFIFGAYSLFLKHPAYAVFNVDRFTLTNVSQLYPYANKAEQLNNYFLEQPKLVVAEFPADVKKKNSLIEEILLKGLPDIQNRPEFFQPLIAKKESLNGKSIPAETLTYLLNKHQQTKEMFEQKYGNDYAKYTFFPLIGNNKKGFIWVFDKAQFKPIYILDIDPWKTLEVTIAKAKK